MPASGGLAGDTIFAKVAGLDVHQKFLTVAGRRRLDTGTLFAEVRTFGAMTRDLLAMADYLQALGATHVALGSTGVLWEPVSGAASCPRGRSVSCGT